VSHVQYQIQEFVKNLVVVANAPGHLRSWPASSRRGWGRQRRRIGQEVCTGERSRSVRPRKWGRSSASGDPGEEKRRGMSWSLTGATGTRDMKEWFAGETTG